MNDQIKLHIALPVLNELENIDKFFECLRAQTYKNFDIYICVNQPEEWWDDDEKKHICVNNFKTIESLGKIDDFSLTIIDKSSRKSGWKGRKHGVGWARKILMDHINKFSHPSDLIVSLDADTTFSEDYFSSIIENFNEHPEAKALSVPYYHNLVEDEDANRAMLRYEIYMRYYVLNLWRIESPYSFTALGSAIVIPIRTYRIIGGLTPKKSGEDFYFLQKLKKFGNVLTWNNEKVYPGTRFSDRVYFGTGPAMIKGNSGDWKSYPIYDYKLFDNIKETYDVFPELFSKNIKTPLDDFFKTHFDDDVTFENLRNNNKTPENFVKACHEKFDGLRILQYLKEKQSEIKHSDETNLLEFFEKFYPKEIPDFFNNSFSFQKAKTDELDILRNILMNIEEKYQRKSIGN